MDDDRELELLRRMSPARKLAVMNGLIREAWVLRAAMLRTQRPELSRDEVEKLARAAVAGDYP